MRQKITRDYYIELGELREIIATYFKEKTGKSIALCNIGVDVKHEPYSQPEFEAVHINIEEEVE
jgi:hypothetical protein